jgi:hypothetical protein
MAEGNPVRRLTRLVRERAPHRLVLLFRSWIQAWGTATARWRMRPSFVIVGAQRAGTTTLYRVLSEHPAVVRPTVSKGIGYFDLHFDRGPRWYFGHFPLRWAARRKHGRDAAAFESSGYYLFPDARVVLMVRDPVERAYSAHQHELARGFESEPFEEALALEEQRTAGEVERILADPTYESLHHRHHSYLARSRYSEQVDRFIGEVGPDRVYVVDADVFFADPLDEFERLRSWLGLPEWRPEKVEQWNARPRTPMSAELRERLNRHFEPYDARLAEQMGRAPSWRSSPRQD